MEKTKWNAIWDESVIKETAKNIRERNIEVEILANRHEALKRIQELIPSGASVMTGGSTTLDEIGFTKKMKSEDHSWINLKKEILAEKDPEQAMKLRRVSTLADYYLGSIHAVSRFGEIVVASATGSQLPAYVFCSPHVIWVVGAQKITADLEAAIKRVREYVLPLEDARMKKEGYPGSSIGKMMILEKESVPGRIRMLLVKEKLGF